MALHLSYDPGKKNFTAYGEGYIAVNGERFERPVVVTPGQVLTDWTARDFASLTPADFEYFVALAPEVVLFGTGNAHQFARPQLFRSLIAAGIGIEFMSTAAACRTYNILAAEDRKVVAAILI